LAGKVDELPELRTLIWVGIASLVVPFTVNVAMLARELNSAELIVFWKFFNTHQIVVSLFVLLSGANCALFNTLAGKLLGLSTFSAPLPPLTQSRLSYRGLVSNVLEDIPQLVIQILVITTQGGEFVNATVIVSVIVSASALTFGIVKRTMTMLMTNVVVKAAKTSSSSSDHDMDIHDDDGSNADSHEMSVVVASQTRNGRVSANTQDVQHSQEQSIAAMAQSFYEKDDGGGGDDNDDDFRARVQSPPPPPSTLSSTTTLAATTTATTVNAAQVAAMCRALFAHLDTDSNAILSWDEYQRFATTVKWTPTLTRDGWVCADSNSDGGIDVDEFVAFGTRADVTPTIRFLHAALCDGDSDAGVSENQQQS
jgi:hypothetical protein